MAFKYVLNWTGVVNEKRTRQILKEEKMVNKQEKKKLGAGGLDEEGITMNWCLRK